MSSAQVAAHTLIYLNTLKHVAVAYLHLPCSVPFCILSCTSSFPTIHLDFCSCVLIQSSQSAGFQSADYVVCLLSIHFIFECSLMVLSLPAPIFNFDILCAKSVVEIDLTSLWSYQCGPLNGIRFSAPWALAPSFPNTVPASRMGCVSGVLQ